MNLLELFDDLDGTLNSSGYCACGCGGITNRYRGKHRKYIYRHNFGVKISNNRVFILMPDHPNSNSENHIMQSHLVLEKKIGRFLKSEEVVHHKDHDTMNDNPDNLILCRDQSEHLSIYHKDKERDANGRFIKII